APRLTAIARRAEPAMATPSVTLAETTRLAAAALHPGVNPSTYAAANTPSWGTSQAPSAHGHVRRNATISTSTAWVISMVTGHGQGDAATVSGTAAMNPAVCTTTAGTGRRTASTSAAAWSVETIIAANGVTPWTTLNTGQLTANIV